MGSVSELAARSRDVAFWMSAIEQEQRAAGMTKWAERCDKIRKRYRYEASSEVKTRKYQMLWSNMETLKPSVYAKPPVGVVSRRWRDADPIGRGACTILERGINFQLETNDFSSRLEQVRDDYLLYARGVARVYYEPVMTTVSDADDEDGLDEAAVKGPEAEAREEVEEAVKSGNPQEILDFEHVKIRYVHREDFVHQSARTWDEVEWVAFRAFLTRESLVDRFGDEIGNAITLDASAQQPGDDAGSAARSGAGGQSAFYDKAAIKTARFVGCCGVSRGPRICPALSEAGRIFPVPETGLRHDDQ
jgi:hypothetical protein